MMTKALLAIITALIIAGTPAPPEPQTQALGEFEITAYSYSEGYGENYQTASGAIPKPYYTVAVDPAVIPLGSTLYIEGIGEVKAQDTGGAVKGQVIDLHIGHDDCDSFGRQKRSVYITRKGGKK